MSTKFALIAASFSVPIALLLHLYTGQVQGQIEFTERELRGTAYLRPLMELQAILREQPTPETDKQAEAAWKELEKAQAEHGVALRFTPEELAKRDRSGLEPRAMRERWEKVRRDPAGAGASQLETDFGKMITHAGDSSNLILDPDLDTYYLMDATLLGMPQLQARLGRIAAEARNGDSKRLEFELGLLREVDLPRVESSTRTAWVEDANFGAARPTLRPKLEAALTAFVTSEIGFIRTLETAADTEPRATEELGVSARRASMSFWRVAVDELDALLQMRVAHLRGDRRQALGWSGVCLLGASMLAFALLQSITRPLELMVRELSPESAAMRASAERLRASRVRDPLTDEESSKLSEELNRHSMTIRRAVIELVAQISGGESSLASRVEGVRWSGSSK